MRITGIAEVLINPALLREIWESNALLRRYLGSPENPELIIYRIRPVRVRFTARDTADTDPPHAPATFIRTEAHLAYKVANTSPVTITFGYKDGTEVKTAMHTYETAPAKADSTWTFDGGAKPETLWVEYSAK